MSFQKITPEKLSTAVVDQIELLILRGVLRPSERLPSERELSDRMGVSRPSLRQAIAELQTRGLLETKAGAGVYVSDKLGAVFPPALVDLFAAHPEAVFDYVSFRRDIEALAAERAANYGSETDLALIDEILKKMEAAHKKRNPSDEAMLDAEFHIAIIEAGHNIIMLHMMRAMFEMLRGGVFYNRQIMFKHRTTRDMLLEQHRAIRDAILARDSAAARAAVQHHLDYVEDCLAAQQKSEHNEIIARQRLDHERAR